MSRLSKLDLADIWQELYAEYVREVDPANVPQYESIAELCWKDPLYVTDVRRDVLIEDIIIFLDSLQFVNPIREKWLHLYNLVERTRSRCNSRRSVRLDWAIASQLSLTST